MKWTTEVSENQTPEACSLLQVSARVRRVPVQFPPSTTSTWGLVELRGTFSQYSTVSGILFLWERSAVDSKATPSSANTPSAWAYSFKNCLYCVWSRNTFLTWIIPIRQLFRRETYVLSTPNGSPMVILGRKRVNPFEELIELPSPVPPTDWCLCLSVSNLIGSSR